MIEYNWSNYPTANAKTFLQPIPATTKPSRPCTAKSYTSFSPEKSSEIFNTAILIKANNA